MSSPKVRLGVAFDGEKEVKTAVSNINAQLKTLKSEAEKVKSAFEGQERSEKALQATSKVLTQTLQANMAKIKTLKDAVKEAADHEEKWKAKINSTEKELADEKAKLDAMKSSTTATTEEIEKQEKVVADLGDRLRKEQSSLTKANTNTEKWKNTLNKAETELNKTQKELDQTNDELGQMSGKADKAGKELDDMADSSGKVGKQLSTAGVALGTFIGNLASDVLRKAAQAMKSLATSTIQVGADFDASMSKVKAVSGATGEQFDKLRDKAREMGATTKFTAAESADALNYMAMAGWKTEEMISGISGVMDLAAASGEDLATTSDIVTDALSAFGLKARDSSHFADILAAASSSANTNVAMMGETFKYAAPVAGALGYSAEDVAEAIGLMANSGIKASQAGTGLRTIMTKLSKDFTISGKELGKVTIATTNADGSMRELSDILGDTREAFSKLSESEKAQVAQSLVGKNAMSAFLSLMQAAPEDVDKVSSAIKNCDGAAKNMAKTMNDNLRGDVDKLKSAWQDLQIELSDSAKGPMRDIVQTITNDIIPAFKALVTGSEHAAGKVRNAFTGLMDKVGNIGGGLVTSFFGEKAGAAVKDTIKVIADSVKDLMGVFKDLGPAIANVIEGSSSFTQHIMPVIVDLIRTLAPLLADITALVSKVIQAIMPAVSSVLHGIIDALGSIFKALSPVFDVIGRIIEELAPTLSSIGQLIGNIFRMITPLAKVLEVLAPILELIGNLLKPIFDFIKLISDGLNWVVEGFLNLIGCGVDKSLEEDRQAMEDFAAECDTARERMDSLRKSRDDSLASIDQEYSGYRKLIEELDGYIDKNGQVKKESQDRAQVIIDQLKNQFGIEVELVDGAVKSWDKLRASIEKEMKIEQLRALVNAGSEMRAQASDVNWMAEQYDLLAEAQTNVEKAEKDLQDAMSKGKGVEEAKSNLEMMNRAYYDVEQTIGHAQKSLDDYDQAMGALASGNVKDLEASIDSMNQAILDGQYLSTNSLGLQFKDLSDHAMQSADVYSKTGAKIHQIQAKNFYDQGLQARDYYEQSANEENKALAEWTRIQDGKLEHARLISNEIWKESDTTIHGKRMNETNAKGQASSRDKPVKAARETQKQTKQAALDGADNSAAGEKLDRTEAQSITDNAEKPKKAAADTARETNEAAENATDGSGAGRKHITDVAGAINDNAGLVYNAASSTMGQANAGGKSVDSKPVGWFWAQGVSSGMGDWLSPISSKAAEIIRAAVNSAKAEAKIKSPSKVTRDEIGKNLSLGIALGIKDGTKAVKKATVGALSAAINAAKKVLKAIKPVGQQLMDSMAEGAKKKIQATTATMKNSVALVLKNVAKTVENYTKNGNYSGAGERLLGLSSSGISAAGNATMKTVTKTLNTQFSAIKSKFNAQIKELTKASNLKVKNLNNQLKKEEKNSTAKLKNLEKQIDAAEKTRDKKLKDAEKERDKNLKNADTNTRKRVNAQFQTQKKQINEEFKNQKKLLQNQIKAEKARSNAQKKALNSSIKAEEKATKARRTTLEKSLKTISDNQTKIVEAAKKQITSEINSLTSYMEQQLDKISDKYQAKYDAIKAKNDALRSTLEASTSERFTEATDRRGHVTVTLTSIAAQTKKINAYMENLKKIRTTFTKYASANVAQSMVDEIVGMGLEDGNKYMTAVLGQTAAKLKSYVSAYKTQLGTIAGFTSTNLKSKAGFYTADFKAVQAGYNKEISALQKTITKKFDDIGKNAAKAFASGTKSNQNAVVKAVKELGNTAIKELKKTLGIKSPSRVFKELGFLTDEGLAIGIDDNAKLAVDAVGRMSEGMIAAMENTSAQLAMSANGANALARRQNMSIGQERPIVVITEIDGKQVGYATAKYVTRQQAFERRGAYA